MFSILIHGDLVIEQFTLHIEELFEEFSVDINSNLTSVFKVKHTE
jgi:hypothetical protein